jgi:hypothetical protein
MLLLLPIIVIILALFGANMYYSANHTMGDTPNNQEIVREGNQTDGRQDYINKYLKK